MRGSNGDSPASGDQFGDESDASWSVGLDIVTNELQRRTVRALCQADTDRLTLASIATSIRNDTEGSTATGDPCEPNRSPRSTRARLHHVVLPKLHAEGLVTYDAPRNVVVVHDRSEARRLLDRYDSRRA